MIFGLGKFWRQFWKAYCKYFPKVIILQLLTAIFGGRIVMKPPILKFLYKSLKKSHLLWFLDQENFKDSFGKLIVSTFQRL